MPRPTRGAPLTDFRGVSRQLAGFSQHADAAAERAAIDGPSAGEPTLIGVRLAAERGEQAPAMDQTPGPPHPAQAQGGPRDGAGTPAQQAGDATVGAAGNPAEKAGAEQVHTDAPEPAGRQPAERGAEGTDTPPTGSGAGQNSSVEREV
jgi:NADH-quinone oxidoreductase subunit E